MKFLLVLLICSSSVGEQSHSVPAKLAEAPTEPTVKFSVEGQEQCEQICLGCVGAGNEPEKCTENLFFRLCCHQNGGHTDGCGCREGL
jgi:hypothetical protein